MMSRDPVRTKMILKRRKVNNCFFYLPFLYGQLMVCCWFPVAETKEGIEDRTETNLVNLHHIIYLTIMNALNYEEAVHKLLKIELQKGQEVCTLFFWGLCRIDEKNKLIGHLSRLSSST